MVGSSAFLPPRAAETRRDAQLLGTCQELKGGCSLYAAALRTAANCFMSRCPPQPAAACSLQLLWRRMRTCDEDGALDAIRLLQQLDIGTSAGDINFCSWTNSCSGDGSALLHTVCPPTSRARLPLAYQSSPSAGIPIQRASSCVSSAGFAARPQFQEAIFR